MINKLMLTILLATGAALFPTGNKNEKYEEYVNSSSKVVEEEKCNCEITGVCKCDVCLCENCPDKTVKEPEVKQTIIREEADLTQVEADILSLKQGLKELTDRQVKYESTVSSYIPLSEERVREIAREEIQKALIEFKNTLTNETKKKEVAVNESFEVEEHDIVTSIDGEPVLRSNEYVKDGKVYVDYYTSNYKITYPGKSRSFNSTVYQPITTYVEPVRVNQPVRRQYFTQPIRSFFNGTSFNSTCGPNGCP